MLVSVDLCSKNFLRACQRQRTNLRHQLLLRARAFLLNFSGCRCFDSVSLGARGLFGFVNHSLGALIGGLNDASSLSLSIG